MKILISPFSNYLTALLLCPFMLLASVQCASQANAQQVETVTVKKVIAEPVHRVPKVAAMAVGANLAGASVGSVSTPISAILPSAAIKRTQPTFVEPAAAPIAAQPKAAAPHPLDGALKIAVDGLENIRATIQDYSAILVKRERVDGQLMKPEYMQVKIRRGRVDEDGKKIPFSIYMKFIKPQASAGRELIWVKGQNDDKLCVHEGSGIVSLKCFNLDPDGWLAMQGQRYPIYEAGVENLVVKLIEKATRDRAAGDCEVVYRDGVKINGRCCSVIEVTHPEQREPYDFHIAKVFIDDELQLPVRYQAHIWPEPGSTKPVLLEEYTYLNIKVNQGFSDLDFDPDNPAYKFPGR